MVDNCPVRTHKILGLSGSNQILVLVREEWHKQFAGDESKLVGVNPITQSVGWPGSAPKDAFVVAADAVGAGLGDLVMLASGSSARQTTVTDGRPIDATVMAIVDLVESQREYTYRKDEDNFGATR